MRITDVEGLAKILGIPESSVMLYVRNKKIPCFKIGKHKRFDVDEVLKACSFGKESNARST